MKRILIAGVFALAAGGQALAADLPPPVAPPPRAPATYVPVPVQVFSWTGIYVGINGGYNFGTVTPTGGGGFNTSGFLIGGTVGGNYQIGQFVIGLEGDGDYNSQKNNISTGHGGAGATFTSDWLATARGRAGYAWDRVLFYGTGGAAFAPAAITGFNTATMTGWTVGGGVEAAFAPNWTAKVEYLYIDYPSTTITGVGSFKDVDNVIRAGINYKFW
jgi:outer membrane immunogenic protein